MRAADLVICPSRSEGMPLVPMEAIQAGACVVASGIEAHRELLGGVEGSLLPDDEGVWGDWIAALLVDRTRRASIALRQSALRRRFSFGRLLDEYRALYESVLAGDQPSATLGVAT